VRFLVRFFETNRLTPFAAYCTIAGAACLAIFLVT
jgi:undecaprenyl-diphosphatase